MCVDFGNTQSKFVLQQLLQFWILRFFCWKPEGQRDITREYRVTMANNLIGCWESPAANQIIRCSNPLFGQLNNTKQIKQQ